jgi:hypothetical protein
MDPRLPMHGPVTVEREFPFTKADFERVRTLIR